MAEIAPEVLAAWRASELGRLTEAREVELVFEVLGDVSGKRLLDVGCGDGSYVIEAARRGALATGIDIVAPMLAAAQTRSAAAGVEVALQRADVRALPFEDASFDVVLAVTVLCFVEAEPVLREMARVVRPGGRVVLADLGAYSLWALRRKVRGWRGDPFWRSVHFSTPRRLRAVARAAGLLPQRMEAGVYFPPNTRLARWLAPHDASLGRLFACGAAFLVLDTARRST